MWVGGNTGVGRFQKAPRPFVNYQYEPRNPPGSLRNNSVLSVYEDAYGFLWVGTEGGLHRLDRNTGQVSFYQHDAKDPHSLSYNMVTAIREDGKGGLWIGTHGGGLNRFDRVSGGFFAYRHHPKDPQSLSSDLIQCLWVDPNGVVWIGTHGGGLNRFDPVTGHSKTYSNDLRDAHSLSEDNVREIFADRAGTLWIGTNRGLNRFDRGSEQFTVYLHDSRDPSSLSHNSIGSIYEDRQGALWVGTRNGLDRFDRTHGLFESFTTKDGLADDAIEAIREDRRGNLWLATHQGVSAFNPATKTVRNYSESDGLLGDFANPNGEDRSYLTREGEIVFGSQRGLSIFDPERLAGNPYLPPVVLTDILLFNKPVQPGRNSPIQQPIWAAHSLTLGHNQSIFTLEFAALSYVAPEKNRYRFRLEGFEKEWNEVDGERRVATYTSLPAGDYVFRVQGSNNDLLWNETGVQLAISVLPPWWGTWWFRTALALLVIGLMITAYRLRTRGLRLTAARLELQVAERTRELKAAKESAEVAKEAAESANRAKSAFLSHMSHELRTPLNSILGFANLLRDDAATEKQRANLDIIHRSGEHLLTLISDVLDAAKLEAGRATVEIAPCDLGQLVRDVSEMMRGRAVEKNLELRIVQSSVIPRFVETDGPKLRQMLINLLGNAIKHTESGSVTLRLTAQCAAEQVADDWALLIFEVEDTGTGIAPEDQERIFEPFVQVGDQRQKGTGLGLPITRQFASMLGGTIRLTSALGEGSLFRLEIPAKVAKECRTDANASERKYLLKDGQPPYRIVVVDDVPENRELLQNLLEKAGFQVRLAGDGVQAVVLFQSWRPHFIWMDLRMPKVDGAEAARRIRALEGGKEVKIAAVTASEDTNPMPDGMDDLVRKPYRASEIFECMTRHLGVNYRSDDTVPAPSGKPAATLRLEALAALPDDLRAELTLAVLALDRNHIDAVIKRVSELDPVLGSALALHADDLAFSKVLEALRECKRVAA